MDDIICVGEYKAYTLYHADSISSTNTHFRDNEELYPEKSVLDADIQYGGRGRGSHVWKSDNDITFSILSRKNLHYDFIAPLAVLSALRDFGVPASIKWPNDIYAGMRKISGMLIERTFNGENLRSVVIGIGINRNEKAEFHAAGLREYSDATKDEVIRKILDYFDFYSGKDTDELSGLYAGNNMVLGMEILHNGREYLVTGFTESGALRVTDKEGCSHIILSDEISIKESVKDYDRYFKG